MSAEIISSPIIDNPLALAYEVCGREIETLNKVTEATWKWIPEHAEGFSEPIALSNIVMAHPPAKGLEICRVTYTIGGDDEVRIEVGPDNQLDEFSEHYLQKFELIYKKHFHDVCLRGVRLKRLEEKRRERLHQRQAEINRSMMVVKDKRHSATLQNAGN